MNQKYVINLVDVEGNKLTWATAYVLKDDDVWYVDGEPVQDIKLVNALNTIKRSNYAHSV